MIFPRKLKKRIQAELDNELVIVITGMRRVGKTFLLRDIFNGVKTKNSLFLDLEKPENLAVFKEDSFEAVIANLTALGLTLNPKVLGRATPSSNRAWVFLDEIQLFKKIPSVIKYLSDHYAIKFIVSGSSSFYLKNLFSESLSGRKVIFHLAPLDFGEFLVFKDIFHGPYVQQLTDLPRLNTSMFRLKYAYLFEEFLTTGGFPQAVLERDAKQRDNLLQDILQSYLSIDVRSLSDFKGIDDLEKLIRVLPPRIGQKLDMSKLASEIGIARMTVKNYLTFLKDTFVIDLVYPYSKSPDREISSTPKLYFCDVGLASSLWNISGGQRLENAVYTHLVRTSHVQYYRRKSGLEVDFIVEGTIGVEVKLFASDSDYRKLKRTAAKLGLSTFYVLSERFGKSTNKHILPAFLLGFLE